MKKTSRKSAKAQSVRSPRVSKGAVSNDALTDRPTPARQPGRGPHGRTSDTSGFSPTLGEMDLHLFGEGKHERIYEKLGAHATTHEGKRGVAFAVWAPNAKSVNVVGDFNGWDSGKNPMRSLGGSG